MQKVVSNSTPIIHLAKLGYLNLLEELYNKIFITRIVYEECTSFPDPPEDVKKEIESIQAAPFIQIGSVENDRLILAFSQLIDMGEASAIALAVESQAGLILIDDSEARKVADVYNLNFTGTIGVLLKAREVGLISESTADILNKLRRTGFYLSPGLENFFLKNLKS
jgi:predicted nucleic acid-binding protein